MTLVSKYVLVDHRNPGMLNSRAPGKSCIYLIVFRQRNYSNGLCKTVVFQIDFFSFLLY